LVDNCKASAIEMFRTPVLYEDGTSYDESTWPMFLCCKKGQYTMFSALLPYYNTPELLNMSGGNNNTSLMIACTYGNVDIVAELLALGANVNMQNEKGDTALVYAIQKGFFQ
jgi:ankyrin repeat protein